MNPVRRGCCPEQRVSPVMRKTISFGALVLSLSGSAILPGLADPSSAALLPSASAHGPDSELVLLNKEDSTPVEPAEPRLETLPPSLPLGTGVRIRSVRTGHASWYGPGFYGGRTANGERFTRGTLTAAHRHLPFGTRVRVTNLRNGRSAVVRINDRGPFHGDRVIDLAHGAADVLGLIDSGIARVRLEVLGQD